MTQVLEIEQYIYMAQYVQTLPKNSERFIGRKKKNETFIQRQEAI